MDRKENKMDAEEMARKFLEESDLPADFPYQSINEIIEAVNKGHLVVQGKYSADILNKFCNKTEKNSHNFWLAIPFIIILAIVVLAFYYRNYYLLFGVLLALIGFFLSTPYFKSRALLYVISLGLFIYFIVKSNMTGYVLSGSFLFSLWAAMTARHICAEAIKRISLTSTRAFNHLLRDNAILVYDKQADKFY